jgi:prepilin-type N-terminal cleavage/methylation domain-containing protein
MAKLAQNVRSNAAHRRGGFTLVEILISVALVLLLILGVNEVFRLTSRAVGAGQQLSEINRNARNAQSIIYNDLTHADVINGPFLFIKSETSVAFRNREDQLSDKDFIVTEGSAATADTHVRSMDLTKSGTETTIPRAFLTRRTHRTDMLKLFARNLARRQTGDNNSFTTGIVSSEQYICYGHLRQPADPNTASGNLLGIRGGGSNTYQSPTTNTHNFYASDWTLGRTVFVMQEPETANPGVTGSPRYMYDRSTGTPVKVTYMTRGNGQAAKDSAAPFTQSSQATNDGVTLNGVTELVQYSYYDIAGFSMGRYASDLSAYIANGRTGLPPFTVAAGWWNGFDYRFTGYPIPSRPLTRTGVARTVPCFVQHCSQFVVEYAGDFLQQDPTTGAVTGVAGTLTSATGGTDGEIDFMVDPVTQKHTIRWYGFPRNVTADDKIDSNDVVPLRDIAGVTLPFERTLPTTSTPPDYAVEGVLASNAAYTCVWGPDTAHLPKPKLLRITMAIDDPSSRLTDEQFFEYVVALP